MVKVNANRRRCGKPLTLKGRMWFLSATSRHRRHILRAFIYSVLISAQLTGQIELLIFHRRPSSYVTCFHAHLIRLTANISSRNRVSETNCLCKREHTREISQSISCDNSNVEHAILINKYYVDLNQSILEQFKDRRSRQRSFTQMHKFLCSE